MIKVLCDVCGAEIRDNNDRTFLTIENWGKRHRRRDLCPRCGDRISAAIEAASAKILLEEYEKNTHGGS